jgi:hypothetical protein
MDKGFFCGWISLSVPLYLSFPYLLLGETPGAAFLTATSGSDDPAGIISVTVRAGPACQKEPDNHRPSVIVINLVRYPVTYGI